MSPPAPTAGRMPPLGVSCLGILLISGLSLFGLVGTSVLLGVSFRTLRVEGTPTPAELHRDAIAGPIILVVSLAIAGSVGVALARLWFGRGTGGRP